MNANRRQVLLGAAPALGACFAWARRPLYVPGAWSGMPLAALIPAQAGGWTGSEADARIVLPVNDDALADALYAGQVARVYHKPGAADVLLVVAAAGGSHTTLMVHRPEACYPAAGFVITCDQPLRLDLPGAQVAARYLTAQCDDRIEQVLFWTRIGHGFPLTSAQEQLTVARYALARTIPTGALVRMSIVTGDRAGALATLTGFAQALVESSGHAGRSLMVLG